MQRLRFVSTCLFLGFLLFAGAAKAQSSQHRFYTNKDGVAINGYDVVAYFNQNRAVRGSQKYAVNYKGTHFWFSSQKNRAAFLQHPEKYLPQYGGWCAFAMASGNGKVPSDPKTFKLYNGKLYLFFNDYYRGEPFNTIIPWNLNEKTLKNQADANWAKANQS
ncbi:YHS domain-containing protein [Candidatus Parcubacteria bacterium]|nr:MAG: YHS domain-containing protein [Candidatus Parcubacteria bacterium]